MTATATLNKDVYESCLEGEDEYKLCENIDLWTADLRFHIQAGLLTLFIAILLFPVSQ